MRYLKPSIEILLVTLVTLWWYRTFLFTTNVGIFDWAKESYFYSFLRQSLVELKQFPLVFGSFPPEIAWYPTLARSNSYIGNPEVLTFSPFMLVMPFFSAAAFLKIYFALHLIVAGIGLYLLANKFQLSLYSKLLLLLLTLLHPWLMQHLAIGFTPWITACYVPLILWLYSGEGSKRLPLLSAAFLNALIIMEGGVHIFCWLNGTIVLYSGIELLLTKKFHLLKKLSYFLAGSALLVAPKCVAVMRDYQGYKEPINTSYSSVSDLYGILTDTQYPQYLLPQEYSIYGINIYDGSLALGVTYFIFVVLGAGFLLAKGISRNLQISSLILLLCSLVWFVLGWGGVWEMLSHSVSLLSIERYPYRFLFISLLLFTFAVVVEVSRSNQKALHGIVTIFLIVLGITSYQRVQYFAVKGTSNPASYGDLTLLPPVKGPDPAPL